jgi:antitoxin component YwqK of YwqJK toxin-antitoxin module
MKYFLLLIFSIAITNAFSQATIPIKFTSEENNKLIKETDTLKYYEATGDPESVVSIDEDASYYKLLGKNHKTIDEGSFISEDDKVVQDGKWTGHFEDGKVKISGYYKRGKPIGSWKEFYPEGRIKTIYNYAVITEAGKTSSCLSGSYQEFYPDGKLKVNGFYAAERMQAKDTIAVDDPITGNKTRVVTNISAYKPEKTGHWEYYSEDGEVDKKEEF